MDQQGQGQGHHGEIMLSRSASLDEHYELAAFQRHQQQQQQQQQHLQQQQQQQAAALLNQQHEQHVTNYALHKFGVERETVVKME